MGLDAVELVLEVEDAFDVQIPDDRATQIVTVGHLYNFIIESKGEIADPRRTCLSAATFFMIRRAIVSELDIAPRSLRPRTSVDAILPASGRRAHWARLQNRLDLKLPKLCRPKWLATASSAVTVIAALLASIPAYHEWGLNHAAFVGTLALFLMGAVAWQATAPFATHPRPGFATFRGLSHVVLAHNYATLSGRFNTWSPTDVWDALQIIIVEQLDVRPEQVTRDASFVEDLGLD